VAICVLSPISTNKKGDQGGEERAGLNAPPAAIIALSGTSTAGHHDERCARIQRIVSAPTQPRRGARPGGERMVCQVASRIQDDRDGLAIACRQHRREVASLSPISATATTAAETKNASIGAHLHRKNSSDKLPKCRSFYSPAPLLRDVTEVAPLCGRLTSYTADRGVGHVPRSSTTRCVARKEPFAPLDAGSAHVSLRPDRLRLCACRQWRPVVVFDVLYRLLKRRYPGHLMCATSRHRRPHHGAGATNGETIESLTTRTADAYQATCAGWARFLRRRARATQLRREMVGMIQRLVDNGHAYAAEGHVLFSVPSMSDYGRLSRHTRDELWPARG